MATLRNNQHLQAVLGSDNSDTEESPSIRLSSRSQSIRLTSAYQDDLTEFERSRRQYRGTDEVRIFDGRNTPQNISSYGFILGAICGGGIVSAVLSNEAWQMTQFGLFLSALSLFHFLEYLATALFNPHKLSLDSFLINHSAHYHIAHAVTMIEFLAELYFVPSWKKFGLVNYIGVVLVIVGQTFRTTAMFSARHNFSHHIVEYKTEDHVLVTHGVYSIMRHPSYFGFYWWAVGIQVLLMNPVGLVLVIYYLHQFFSSRISYEEAILTRFFKEEWTQYKARTPTWMPLIP